MSNPELEKKKMSRTTMLAKIEDVLKRGNKGQAPAYTLILGAGASFGVVPTAKEMLGFPDSKTGKIHDKSIPIWLAKQMNPEIVLTEEEDRLQCSKDFWKDFLSANVENACCKAIKTGNNGFPDNTTIANAYQAVFDTSCIGGLDTPERHGSYLRDTTMAAGSTPLNGTHFYLASLLSLQKQTGKIGIDGKPLYTGKREFARTIFTTNFDPLLQTSLQLFQLLYYMTDRPEFLSADALQTDHHPAIHLFYAHGSVHRPYMANTEEQIELLKNQNARDLSAYLAGHGVIVLGYSGWDDCLLEALNQTKTYANNLYWLIRTSSVISQKVTKFLLSHPNAYLVEIEDGGSFMAEIHNKLCPGAPNTELLYNPIRPLLAQLECVSLSGIQTALPPVNTDTNQTAPVSDTPTDVEAIRKQVIQRLKDAQKHFTTPTNTSTPWEELERQAELSYANKDWDSALKCYDQLLTDVSVLPVDKKAIIFFRRGNCHSKKGEIEEAIKDYTAVINLPDAPTKQIANARVNRGVCHVQKGETDKAIEDYTTVINLADASPEQIARARVNRGICHSQKGETDKAIEDYVAVINLPGVPAERIADARFGRGFSYGQKGEMDKAIEDYTAVIGLPGTPAEEVAKARVNRGICHGQKGETDKEIDDYTAVINLPGAPTEHIARARVNRGVCHGQKGEIDKEIDDYTTVINLPGSPAEHIARARVNRGVCHVQKGETDKAIEDYTTVINLADASPEQIARARVNRGVCHGQKGETDKEIDDYTTVINLPGSPTEQIARARVNRGIRYGQKGETDKEIDDYTVVINLPGSPAEQIARARVNRGNHYRQTKQKEKACEDYSAVVQLPGTPADLIKKAKRLLNKLKETD